MKKTNPAIERGKQNEERFIALARSLRTTHPWVHNVKKASKTLDGRGVDVLVFLASSTGGADIKVPVQIKSSRGGFEMFRAERPECIEAGVITVIVNEFRSDDEIKQILLDFLIRVRDQNTDYSDFLSRARRGAKNVRQQFGGPGKQTRQHRLWQLALDECELNNPKGGCL